LNKNVIYLGLVSFFTDFATALINPLLPIFIVVYLNEGVDKLGFVVALSTFFSYALRVVSGYISDRYGIHKPLLVAGYGLSAVSKPLLGFSQSYKSVAILRSLERIGKAIRTAPKDSMLAFYGEKKMGRTFGLHQTLDIAGEFGGTVALFLVLLYLGTAEKTVREVFFFTAIPGAIALFILIFFVEDIKKGPKKVSFFLERDDLNIIAKLFFYFLFLFFFFNEAFFTVAAKNRGIDTLYIPILFLLSTFTQTLTSYLSGVLIDRYGAQKILALSLFFGTAAQGVLLIEQKWAVAAAFILFGLFNVFSLNSARSYIARGKSRGTLYGLFYAAMALFGAAGAYIIGLLWQKIGEGFTVKLSFAFTFLAATLFCIRSCFGSDSK